MLAPPFPKMKKVSQRYGELLARSMALTAFALLSPLRICSHYGDVILTTSRAGMNVYRPVVSVKVKAPKRKMFWTCWSGVMFAGTATVNVVADMTVGEATV